MSEVAFLLFSSNLGCLEPSFGGLSVKRYHFHIRCGSRVLFDHTGRLLPGLTEAALQADRIARTLLRREPVIAAPHQWSLDVREADDVKLFTLPFSDVHLEPSDEPMSPEELPNMEAVWTLAQGQTG